MQNQLKETYAKEAQVTAKENNSKRIQLNEVQEKLYLGSLDQVKKAARAFHRDYPHLDVEDLEGYLYEELFKSCADYEPELMEGKRFVNMVLRNECRQYAKLARNRFIKERQAYLPSTDEEIDGYDDSYIFVSNEDMEETVIAENDVRGAVRKLFELANETEREIMLAVMDGQSIEQIKRRFGFKHHEYVRRTLKRLGKKLGYNPLA